MPPLLQFWAAGTPRPQGSKRLVRGRMIESSRGHAAWRRTVAMAALAARLERGGDWPLQRPARVSIRFFVPGQRDSRPDIDKLTRAVLDAIVEAGVLRDDSQVVWLSAVKEQAGGQDKCGALVSVMEE